VVNIELFTGAAGTSAMTAPVYNMVFRDLRMVGAGKGGCSCGERFVIEIASHGIKVSGRGGDGWERSKDHIVVSRSRGHKLARPLHESPVLDTK